MSRDEAWAQWRYLRREYPGIVLGLSLIPIRVGLMVAVVRAITHASAAVSFAALAGALLAWGAVEYGAQWAAKKPDEDAPGKWGAECEPEEYWSE